MNIYCQKQFFFAAVLLVGINLSAPDTVYAAEFQIDSNELSGLSYRLVGPMRGGRATRVARISGGPGSGLFYSSDSGDTWKRLTGNGLPDGVLGKIGVAVSPADPSRPDNFTG